MTYLYIIIGIFILWSLYGYFSSRVERAQYSIVDKKGDYEVRSYPAHIVAETRVKGPYNEALNEGFRIVASYIFGGNTKKESIAMTAPVIEKTSAREKIAMTAPVIATIEGEYHVISFGMPRSKTLETLPLPDDPRVKIVTIPQRKMAVRRFSWLRTDARVNSAKKKLLESLQRDGASPIGEVEYAGYNAPWTPPWMTRNEVMVEVG